MFSDSKTIPLHFTLVWKGFRNWWVSTWSVKSLISEDEDWKWLFRKSAFHSERESLDIAIPSFLLYTLSYLNFFLWHWWEANLTPSKLLGCVKTIGLWYGLERFNGLHGVCCKVICLTFKRWSSVLSNKIHSLIIYISVKWRSSWYHTKFEWHLFILHCLGKNKLYKPLFTCVPLSFSITFYILSLASPQYSLRWTSAGGEKLFA